MISLLKRLLTFRGLLSIQYSKAFRPRSMFLFLHKLVTFFVTGFASLITSHLEYIWHIFLLQTWWLTLIAFFFQITWMSPKHILISIGEKRIIDDTRMSIIRPRIPDWNLQIRELEFYDRGMYICSLNTKPMSKKNVYLEVYG